MCAPCWLGSVLSKISVGGRSFCTNNESNLMSDTDTMQAPEVWSPLYKDGSKVKLYSRMSQITTLEVVRYDTIRADMKGVTG